MNSDSKILLVEDDESLGYLLSEYLKIKGFEIEWVNRGKLALDKLEKENFSLVILDLMLPDIDGFEIAGIMKETAPEIPFLFLTARSLKIDVLKGFSLGAVDYIKKPIDEEELVVRIQAILSRLQPAKLPEQEFLKIGDYELDTNTQQLRHNQENYSLTSREAELLAHLIEHKNQLASHKEILVKLWGENDYFNRKSLNVFISRLRKYLQHDGNLSIENVHGKGFILKDHDNRK